MKENLDLICLQRIHFSERWGIVFSDADWNELQVNMAITTQSTDKIYQLMKQTNSLPAFIKWMVETKGTFLLPKL